MKVLDNCQQKFRYLVGVGRALTMKYLWNVSSYRTNCDSDATLGRSVWQSLVFEEAQLAIYKQTNFKFFSLSVAPPRFKQKSWGSVQLAVNSTTQARYVTIEKEDVFSAKTNFKKNCVAVCLISLNLDSRVFPLEFLVVYKSGWTQENPSQSYLIDKIWYNMIWYDMEQYGMIWYLIGSQLLKLFAYYFSAEMSMRAPQLAKYPLLLVLKTWSWKYLSLFLDQFSLGYFAEGYLVVIAILWECYSIFHLPLLYLSVTFIIPPTEPFPRFPTKSHIHIALYLPLLKTIVSTKSHLLLMIILCFSAAIAR